MSTTKKVQRNMRLSSTLFRSLLLFTCAVIAFLGITLSAIYYFSYERSAEEELSALAQDAALHLDQTAKADKVLMLQQQFSGEMRYTLIDPEGEVLFDSHGAGGTAENHANRPEVQEAYKSGHASLKRYSDTLQTDTIYAAVKLNDGSVIRLAETRHSLIAFLSGLIVPVLLALSVAVVLTLLLSRRLTRNVMKPIDALNFSKPLDNDIYDEMKPLLKRIDEQQDQLRQQNKELALAENMRREFSSNVSHEMKTPLQVISGYAELMTNDLVPGGDSKKVATLIYDEAQAMRKLIDDVLVISRLDEANEMAEGERLDLQQLTLKAKERLESFASKQGVQLCVAGTSAYIYGNETLATEMVYNLIENAIKYNHPSGRVTVETSIEHDCSVVRVTDTGVGIPEDLHDKIFERFYCVDKSRSRETGGTGLGLAIVKHAALYHQGEIAIKSMPGEGTTFTLTFPLVQDGAKADNSP